MAKAALIQVESNEELVTGGVEEVVIGKDDSMDAMDAMFSELEAGLTSSLVVVDHSEENMIAAGRAATNEGLRNAALEEMEENAKPHPDDSALPTPKAAKPAPSTKRISTMGMSKSEALATALGDKLDSLLTIDVKDLDLTEETQFDKRLSLLDAIDKLPVKIGEKVINLFAHISKGATLSNYTIKAIAHLNEAGELTSKSLKDVYLARPYTEGTSSSQATQMMKMLPLLGLATREGNKLVKNETSLLLPMLTPEKESEVA